MPKIGTNISSEENTNRYTVVNSRTYGKHLRAKRGTHKPLVVTGSMKKAGELLRSANLHAKTIFDAFKPYCTDMRDGTLWSRLVSLFTKQLHEGNINLETLFENFYFHRRRTLRAVLQVKLEITQPAAEENAASVRIKVNSTSAPKTRQQHPDGYEQIILAVFLDADFNATVLSDTSVHPAAPGKDNEHVASFPCPVGARSVIIAMKCTHRSQGKACTGIAPGMSVIKVVNIN